MSNQSVTAQGYIERLELESVNSPLVAAYLNTDCSQNLNLFSGTERDKRTTIDLSEICKRLKVEDPTKPEFLKRIGTELETLTAVLESAREKNDLSAQIECLQVLLPITESLRRIFETVQHGRVIQGQIGNTEQAVDPRDVSSQLGIGLMLEKEPSDSNFLRSVSLLQNERWIPRAIVDQIGRGMDSSNPEVRVATFKFVTSHSGERNEASARVALELLAKNPSSAESKKLLNELVLSCNVISKDEIEPAADLILKCLDNSELQASALIAIAGIGNKLGTSKDRAVKKIGEIFLESKPGIAILALSALDSIGTRGALDSKINSRVVELLDINDIKIRAAACMSLMNSNTVLSVSLLKKIWDLELLKKDIGERDTKVLSLIGQSADPTAVDFIESIFDQSYFDVRLTDALIALKRSGVEKAGSLLRDIFRKDISQDIRIKILDTFQSSEEISREDIEVILEGLTVLSYVEFGAEPSPPTEREKKAKFIGRIASAAMEAIDRVWPAIVREGEDNSLKGVLSAITKNAERSYPKYAAERAADLLTKLSNVQV